MSKNILFAVSFLLILIGAIWVRTYHYNDWLFFKWDQARDAILLAPAIEHGPEHLPLLGPRATKIGDDYLRLGPAYYYIQYLTGVIFSSTDPAIFAYSDLFFSIASIILLYLFLRVYFTQGISLLATSMYSFSFLVVQYSRFSWNPNSVPFFTLLTFYGLLRFSIATRFKHKLQWLALWALGFSIASQYHFFAFFVLTGVSGIFIIYYFITTQLLGKTTFVFKRLANISTYKKIISTVLSKKSFSYVLVTLVIFSFLYTPVIVSDIKTHGSNTKLFFQMFNESGREDKSFSEKLIRNFREQGDNYSLLTTSFRHRAGMKADPLTVGFGLFIIFSGLLLIKKEYSFKKDFPERRNFLILLTIWIGVFFIITIPASYQLRPRYFVPVFPIPFIIIALWFSALEKKVVKHYSLLIITITLVILGANIYGINQWFSEQSNSQEKNFKTYRTLILKHRDGITLNQLQEAVKYLNQINKEQSENSPIVYTSATEYYLPFQYLFRQTSSDDILTPQAVRKDVSDLKNKEIVYVINNGENKLTNKKLRPYLKKISSKQFGQLFIHKMKIINKKKLKIEIGLLQAKKELNQGKEGALKKDQPKNNSQDETGKTKRLFWKDVIN